MGLRPIRDDHSSEMVYGGVRITAKYRIFINFCPQTFKLWRTCRVLSLL